MKEKTFCGTLPISISFTTSQEDMMRTLDVCVGLIRSVVVACSLVFGWSSFVLAEEPTGQPAPSPTVQEEKGTPAKGGEVQERGISRGQFGGMSTAPIREVGPVGFSCDPKTHTCSCRKSTVGDCDLMKSIACGGDTFNCPGSSQTCTCKSHK